MAWTDTGEIRVQKVPSTPDDDTRAFLDGLGHLGEVASFAPGDVATISHGATVALNAVLQKTVAADRVCSSLRATERSSRSPDKPCPATGARSTRG